MIEAFDPWGKEPSIEPPQPPEHPADPDDAYEQAADLERKVTRQLEDLRVREEARARLAREKHAHSEPPAPASLPDFLSIADEPASYVVDQVWPTGGRVLLAAQFKAGKTTMVGNLLRSLVDGDAFLERFATSTARRVVLIDDELDPRTLRRWLRDQDIIHRDRVQILPLRGRVATFNILDDHIRAHWARLLTGADTIILDCLRPVLDALALDENRDAGRFLVAFDTLLHDIGATEGLVVHHMGHTGERSRGDSRLNDWPDAIWKLVRDKDSEDPDLDDVTGSRYFSAFGRDVNVTQAELAYDKDTRRLTLGEQALNRRQATNQRRALKAEEAVLEVVTATPGINKTRLRDAVRGQHDFGRNEHIDQAVQRLVEADRIYRIKSGNTHMHYPMTPAEDPHLPVLPNVPQPPPGTRADTCPPAYIGGHESTTPPNPDTCPHGMPGGHKPDDFVNGRLSCPQCAQEAG